MTTTTPFICPRCHTVMAEVSENGSVLRTALMDIPAGVPIICRTCRTLTRFVPWSAARRRLRSAKRKAA